MTGFALAWALGLSTQSLLVWIAPEQSFFEHGAPHAQGLAQYGVALDRLLLVRTHAQSDALWACEQALTLPNVTVVCVITHTKKTLSLTATRRLLLTAEKHRTRCILLRHDDARASAAWMRWRVGAAPSQGFGKEMGPPAFTAYLARNRAGPAGLSWRLHWISHDHAFNACALDDAVAAAPADRSAETHSLLAV